MKRARVILLISFMFVAFQLAASSGNKENHEAFSTVDFVFDHISDSHEWHFFTVGDVHVTLPLPVILFSKHTGLHLFWSGKLHSRSDGFPFQLAEDGKNEGKIIETLTNGSTFVPFDMSITKSVLGLILVALFLILFTTRCARIAKAQIGQAPKGALNLVELVVIFIRDDVAKPFIGPGYNRYLPFLITLFTLILFSNLMGLILPLGLNITSNIAVTLALAAITLMITVLSGNKSYWKHIFNPDAPLFMKTPVLPIMQLIEVAGVLIKPTILMIRLFANMLASHIIVTVLIALIFLMSALINPVVGAGMSVISVLFSVFIVMLDILISFIQAYIFTLLSAMYFGNATSNGH